MDVRRIGRHVADAVKAPLPDVTRKLRTSKGVLAAGLDPPVAFTLAERIEKELRATVLIIPDRACVPLQPSMRMRHITFDADGFTCEAYAWDRTENIRVTWNKVFLVSCARVEIQKVVEDNEEPDGRGSFIRPRVPNLITLTHHEFLMDIVLFEPPPEQLGTLPRSDIANDTWRRLRLDQNTVGFSLTEMGHDPSTYVGPLYHSAAKVERFARGVPMNRGVALLSSGAGDAVWESLTFLNKSDVDSYTYWLMQLVRYGYPIPV